MSIIRDSDSDIFKKCVYILFREKNYEINVENNNRSYKFKPEQFEILKVQFL